MVRGLTVSGVRQAVLILGILLTECNVASLEVENDGYGVLDGSLSMACRSNEFPVVAIEKKNQYEQWSLVVESGKLVADSDLHGRATVWSALADGGDYVLGLNITRLVCADRGIYRCRLPGGLYWGIELVKVEGPTGVYTITPDVNLKQLEENGNASFRCRANVAANVGNPNGHIVWARFENGRGSPIITGNVTYERGTEEKCGTVDESRMVLPLTRGDNGTRIGCFVSWGSVTSLPKWTPELIVQFPGTIEKIIPKPLPLYYEYSNPLVFHCSAQGSPAPKITWVHPDGHTLTEQADLTINQPTVGQTGNYTCVVRNTLGTDSRTISIKIVSAAIEKISPKPQPFYYEHSYPLQFHCSEQGHTDKKVTWIHPDKHTITEQADLIISHPTVAQSGNYTCVVNNGQAESNQTISIKIIPNPESGLVWHVPVTSFGVGLLGGLVSLTLAWVVVFFCRRKPVSDDSAAGDDTMYDSIEMSQFDDDRNPLATVRTTARENKENIYYSSLHSTFSQSNSPLDSKIELPLRRPVERAIFQERLAALQRNARQNQPNQLLPDSLDSGEDQPHYYLSMSEESTVRSLSDLFIDVLNKSGIIRPTDTAQHRSSLENFHFASTRNPNNRAADKNPQQRPELPDQPNSSSKERKSSLPGKQSKSIPQMSGQRNPDEASITGTGSSDAGQRLSGLHTDSSQLLNSEYVEYVEPISKNVCSVEESSQNTDSYLKDPYYNT